MKNIVQGVGINNADYSIYKSEKINGKWVRVWTCPYYQKWKSMLHRCYSENYHKKKPTYIGCSVCNDWLLFSNFKLWMENQDWKGKQLDKDILVDGNKIYSPETCVFLHHKVNSFTTESNSARGEYPIGVCWNTDHLMFQAQCRNPFKSKGENLGYFESPDEAHNAWKARKLELAIELANSEFVTDERVRKALIARYQGEK